MTSVLTLNPVQLRVAEDLLAIGRERPVADLSWATDLRAWIDDALQAKPPRVNTPRLRITKEAMAGLLGCEAQFIATRKDFRWSKEIAKGVIVHGGIALAVGGSHAPPDQLAHAACEEMAISGGRSSAAWLGELSPAERSLLIADSVSDIGRFLSSFPPLWRASNAVAEYPLATTIAGGKVRVSGRVDLAMGFPRRRPDGEISRRRICVEIKTGHPRADHRIEHLTYGLLELLRSGVAPFRCATYYTANNTWVADDITLDLLGLAALRLIDATKRLVELAQGREPGRRPGWRCGYCPLSQACSERTLAAGRVGDSNDRR